MAINQHGGGAKTNINGLQFEQEISLHDALVRAGYYCGNDGAVYSSSYLQIGMLMGKHALYKRLLEPRGIYWQDILSKKLLPDDAFYNFESNTVYIIEKKFQHAAGSVDEKLQTCDFKKKQYQRLFSHLNITVEYYYVCNHNFFSQKCYRDVFMYIEEVGCRYFFDEVPLSELGLPPFIQEGTHR